MAAREKHFYVLNTQNAKAFWICRVDGGVSEAIFGVIRPEYRPYFSEKIIMQGETVNVLGVRYTVSPDEEAEQ